MLIRHAADANSAAGVVAGVELQLSEMKRARPNFSMTILEPGPCIAGMSGTSWF